MTLQDIKNSVGLFTNNPTEVELFETMYDHCQLQLFNRKYAAKDYESLRFFKKVIGDTSMGLIVTNGIAPIPTDYFSYESAYYMLGEKPILINSVEDHVYDALLSHIIEYPTLNFPIINIQSDYIRVRPKEVNHIVFSYFIKPENIHYDVTYARGFPEFNESASSPVTWNDADTVLLIELILQNLNIQVSTNQIKEKVK